MDQEELDRRMDWGLFPRDILCALQALHTFQETGDRKYEDELRSCLCDMIEELTPALDDHYKLYLDMVQSMVRGIEEEPLDLDSDAEDGRVSGLQGELEGLYTRILYETHHHYDMWVELKGRMGNYHSRVHLSGPEIWALMEQIEERVCKP